MGCKPIGSAFAGSNPAPTIRLELVKDLADVLGLVAGRYVERTCTVLEGVAGS
jgi:hypothetical protein